MTKFIAALVSATVSGLLYVGLEVEAVKIGYTIRKQQEIRMLSIDRARALQYNIARLKAPHNLENKLSARRISLDTPKSWKTLVMPPLSAGNASAAEPIYRGPFFMRFFVGMAQAEAKESANR